MKKILIVALFFVAMAMAACSSVPTTNPGYPEPLPVPMGTKK